MCQPRAAVRERRAIGNAAEAPAVMSVTPATEAMQSPVKGGGSAATGRSLRDGQVTARMAWLPLIVILGAQLLVVSNFNTLRMSVGAIVHDLGTSSTTVQSALVVSALVTAALIMLSAKAGSRYGPLVLFRCGALLFAVAFVGAAISGGAAVLIVAEAVAGAAAAALLPAVVALIAANYQGRERALALGVVSAAGGAFAMLLAGSLGGAVSWRLPFWILAAAAALVAVGSRSLATTPADVRTKIYWPGVLLSAAAIVLFTLGVNGTASWGLVRAKHAAPLDVLGLSPSLILMLAGIIFAGVFFVHQHRRAASGRTALVSPGVAGSTSSRRALVVVAITLGVNAGFGYLIPMYLQVVQGRGSLETAIRVLPYALALSGAAVLASRLVGRFTVRGIVRWSLALMAVGLVIMGAGIEHGWSSAVVIWGFVLVGWGTGAPLALAASVLIGKAKATVASEVGGVRNTVANLGAAVGTAVAGGLLIFLLGAQAHSGVASSRVLPPELKNRLQLVDARFLANDNLRGAAVKAGLPPAQVDELIRINTNARREALRFSFFGLAALAIAGAISAGGLPGREELRQ